MSKILDALRKIQEESGATQHGGRQHRKIGRMEGADNELDVLSDTAAMATGVDVGQRRFVTIDREAMREAGLIAPEAESNLFEDEYRVIKRPVLSNAFGAQAQSVKDGYVVLVTSAIAGDGKTFTCVNLALSLAREQDTSVLLVDADIRKPHISSLFDAQDEAGLLDYLDHSVQSLDDLIIDTSVNGLKILPTGHSRDGATELLSGSRMTRLLHEIHRSHPRQLLIIDSSPLLQTTESRAIAAVAGQIIVVVRAGETPKKAVLDAIATLDTSKPVNLVLNQVRLNPKSSYYGAYYNGGYGSAYGESNVPRKEEK